MEPKPDEAPAGQSLRQPKKRFVGRRTADAQAQKDSSQKDVESTSLQRGKFLMGYGQKPSNSQDQREKTIGMLIMV